MVVAREGGEVPEKAGGTMIVVGENDIGFCCEHGARIQVVTREIMSKPRL